MVSKVQEEVLFRKSTPIDPIRTGYAGFKQETKILKKGYVHKENALPLPCDIIFERDVAVPLSDGTTIYANVFRPTHVEKSPVIIAWTPYGKAYGPLNLDFFPNRMGIPVEALSGLETFEGPDPAYWCQHGYTIINPDVRGIFKSEGNIRFWGDQEALDGCDLIEWAASQEWSNGKVGLTGNSWLAIMQWFIAAKNPPQLAAIAPWEGISDLYRQEICRGGIPDTGFTDFILTHTLFGNNDAEDPVQMLENYPLFNSYWEDKSASLEKITVPAYVVASYTNELHVDGTFDGYENISSEHKWLRIHNSHEWPDYYEKENVEDLRKFFDRFLKEEDNGWENTPKVRLTVLNPGGEDIINRPETEFPLERTRYERLYLNADNQAMAKEDSEELSVSQYESENKGEATFTYEFLEKTEITGYMKLRLWVSTDIGTDMDLFITLDKLNENNEVLHVTEIGQPTRLKSGRVRVSHRKIDEKLSTPYKIKLAHTEEQLLSPGEIVPVEISLRPLSMQFEKGQKLQLTISGYEKKKHHIPMVQAPETRNKGKHFIHTGKNYDSYLQIPVV